MRVRPRWLVLAAALVLGCVAVLVRQTGADVCGTANAALNRPVATSSTEGAATPGAAAVDGDVSTRWSSEFSDPQWIQVDLGTPVTVCQVLLHWETAYASAFAVQMSPDATTWTTIYSTTTGSGGFQTLDVSGAGRHLRVHGTARGAGGYGYSLWELGIHTTGRDGGGSSEVPVTSPPKPVTASS